MRRFVATFLLALLAAIPLAQAIISLVAAFEAETAGPWLTALIHCALGGVSLTIAVVILGATDDPPRQPLWLYDWRVLVRRRSRVTEHDVHRSRV